MSNYIVLTRNCVAFGAGIIWSLNSQSSFVHHPFLTTLNGTVSGVGAIICADVASSFGKPVSDIVVTGAMLMSSYYYLNEYMNMVA